MRSLQHYPTTYCRETNMIRIHGSELARLGVTPMPWWDREARRALGLVEPGIPAMETEGEDETPTGWYLMSFPNSARDEFVLEVIRKRWEILDGDDADLAAAVEQQIAHDWTAWEGLKDDLLHYRTTPAQANERIWEYVKWMGALIGVVYTEPVESEEDDSEGNDEEDADS